MSDFETRYWLREGNDPWKEVFEEEFIKAERSAGFYPKSGNGVATGGFSSSRSRFEGRVTYGEITQDKRGWDPDFFSVASKGRLVLEL